MRQFLHSNQTPISGTPASQTVPDAHGLELADKVGHEAKCCPGQDRRHVRGSPSAPRKSFRQTNSRSVCRPWVSLRVDPGLSRSVDLPDWQAPGRDTPVTFGAPLPAESRPTSGGIAPHIRQNRAPLRAECAKRRRDDGNEMMLLVLANQKLLDSTGALRTC
jgi:hypothetical protein